MIECLDLAAMLANILSSDFTNLSDRVRVNINLDSLSMIGHRFLAAFLTMKHCWNAAFKIHVGITGNVTKI